MLLEQGWEDEEHRIWERYNEPLGPDGAAMIEYIKTKGCRRPVLGKYFDLAETIRECHDSNSSGENNPNINNEERVSEFFDSDSDV